MTGRSKWDQRMYSPWFVIPTLVLLTIIIDLLLVWGGAPAVWE